MSHAPYTIYNFLPAHTFTLQHKLCYSSYARTCTVPAFLGPWNSLRRPLCARVPSYAQRTTGQLATTRRVNGTRQSAAGASLVVNVSGRERKFYFRDLRTWIDIAISLQNLSPNFINGPMLISTAHRFLSLMHSVSS